MNQSVRETITDQARSLASGTIAHLIQDPRYEAIDLWRHAFTEWCREREGEYECWQDAWHVFGPLHHFWDGESTRRSQ